MALTPNAYAIYLLYSLTLFHYANQSEEQPGKNVYFFQKGSLKNP